MNSTHLLGCLAATATLLPIAGMTAEAQDTATAMAVVKRMTPQVAGLVKFKLNPAMEGFSVQKENDGIGITARDTRLLTAGYGWYLRNIAKVHFSWNGDRLNIPVPMPAPKEPIHVKSPWKVNFAFNYCTLSYTSAFWDWQRWQREIDMLALNGFTHAMVTAGLEKTWTVFLKELGYPEDKIRQFIPNPAFAAWWNMGNLEGHGGPLSDKQVENEAELGRKITARMRELGIVPVLQGYIGFIPSEFKAAVPMDGYKEEAQGNWCGGFVRPSVVDPTCPAFSKLSKTWYAALQKVYGFKGKAFGGDLFHEGGRHGNIDVTAAAKSVQNAMQQASPDSTWIVQCWGGNPSGALLKGLNPNHTLVLNLTQNLHQGTKNMRTFNGIPWVWCELSNFGGNTGMYGGLKQMETLGTDLANYDEKGLVGTGILSEGTETNPLHYEMFYDRIWSRKDIEPKAWLREYALKRYGRTTPELQKALQLLEQGIYNPQRTQEGCTESIMCARPGWQVRKASTWSSGERYYKLADTVKAAELFLKAAKAHPDLMKTQTFRYDLTDITRQVLADAAYYLLQDIKEAYEAGNKAAYKAKTATFLAMMADMDALLGTVPDFRLGLWTNRAQAKGTTAEERKAMLKAAKMQITTWSGRIDSLNDYSNRQWNGLVKDYYMPRWKTFFAWHQKALNGEIGRNEAQQEFQKEVRAFDQSFASSPTVYDAAPKGDPLQAATGIMNKYRTLLADLASKDNATEYQWNLKDTPNEYSVDVTDIVNSPGTYIVTFNWKDGQSALQISSVTLMEGDKAVATDVHEGWTGQENRNNSYTLKLDKYRTNLNSYVIKAAVKGASGNESRGAMTIIKKHK